MGKEREEKFKKVLEILNDAMRFTSKILAVDALFLQDNGEMCLSSDSVLGVHVVLYEIEEQLGGSISNAITLVNELKQEVTA